MNTSGGMTESVENGVHFHCGLKAKAEVGRSRVSRAEAASSEGG